MIIVKNINSVSEKHKLWKKGKLVNKNRKKYLKAKRKAQKVVYQAKCKGERNRLADISRRNDQK